MVSIEHPDLTAERNDSSIKPATPNTEGGAVVAKRTTATAMPKAYARSAPKREDATPFGRFAEALRSEPRVGNIA
jgi:hypothetical protein